MWVPLRVGFGANFNNVGLSGVVQGPISTKWAGVGVGVGVGVEANFNDVGPLRARQRPTTTK